MTLRSVVVVEEHPATAYGGVALRNAAAVQALARLGSCTVLDLGAPVGDLPRSALGEARAVGLGQPPTEDPDALLRAGGHPSQARWSPAADARWAALLEELRPDVVVLEQLWLHAYGSRARDAGARVVLDAHNVEADVYAAIRDAADPAAGRAELDGLMARRTAELESSVARSVDQVWTCSEADRSAFEGLGAAAVVVPNVVDTDGTPLRDPAAREPLLLYPASFAYPPNVRAARVLLEGVLPGFPGGRLALVGHSPPRWMRDLVGSDPRVEVPGRVPSLRPWLERACAVVVPLTEGGGTRFKVLEAMAAGVPVISTAKGVEGLDLTDGRHVLLAEDADDAAAAVRQLWTQGEGDLVREARQRVEERYSWQVARDAVREAVRDLAPPAVG